MGGAWCASVSPLCGAERAEKCTRTTRCVCPCTSRAPPQRATPDSARTSREPHVAPSASSSLLASCPPRCAGQRCPATCVLRFRGMISVRRSSSTGEVVHRGLLLPHRHTILDKLINLLQYFLVNPHLTAHRTHFGRHVVEQGPLAVSLLLMGDGRCLHLAPTHHTALVVASCWHDLLLRLRHGASHVRGSSPWTVMT